MFAYFSSHKHIRDALLSVFFVLFLYILTNNEITHPTPTPAFGKWSIQKIQYPLLLGLAGHNYLVLRDEKNNVVYELHGLATDALTGIWKYVGASDTDKLVVWEFNGSRNYFSSNNDPGFVLTTGSKEDMLMLWEKARTCKEKINEKKLLYPPLGVKVTGETINSNSVAYTLIRCMGLNTRHLGIFTPGAKKDILNGE